MIWVKIRFYINQEGTYADYWTGYPTNDLEVAVTLAKMLCLGYTVGTKNLASPFEARDTLLAGIKNYKIPDHRDALMLDIERLKNG